MLIEFLKSPILIDGKPVINNARLNITSNNQLRLKMACVQGGGEDVPVDIVIYNWTIPKIEKLSIVISVDGKEIMRDVPFHVNLTYDFLKKSWKIKGNFGNKEINRKIVAIADLITIIREYIITNCQ